MKDVLQVVVIVDDYKISLLMIIKFYPSLPLKLSVGLYR